MKLTEILKQVIKEEIDLGTDDYNIQDHFAIDDNVLKYSNREEIKGILLQVRYLQGDTEPRNEYIPDRVESMVITPIKTDVRVAANTAFKNSAKENGELLQSTVNEEAYALMIAPGGPYWFFLTKDAYEDYYHILATLAYSNKRGLYSPDPDETIDTLERVLMSNTGDNNFETIKTKTKGDYSDYEPEEEEEEEIDPELEMDPDDHPMYNRRLREDIFLKKDPDNKQIIVFSDKEDKRAAAKETISLAKAFRKAGLDWDGKLGHWVGPYSALAEVNGLIKSHNKIKEVIEDLDAMEDFVASSDADPTAKSTIMDNLETYIDDLANATDQATMDAAIKNYLTFYSRFHNYSFTNSMLIYMQKRDATKVAGYNTWKKQNRGVKKGAKAIWIWFPMTIKGSQETETSNVDFGEVDKAAKSRNFTRFSLGKVYDISDTYPLNEKGDIPAQPKWFADNEPSEVADQLVERVKEFANDLGIRITKDDAKGGEKGFSAGGHINLSSEVEGVGAASTLIHELAHELLHWKEKSPFHVGEATRDMQELQAESVSYVVLKHYGLPVTQHPTYLALWKANKDKIKANLQVIQKCAKYIIDGIDAQESDNKEEL